MLTCILSFHLHVPRLSAWYKACEGWMYQLPMSAWYKACGWMDVSAAHALKPAV